MNRFSSEIHEKYMKIVKNANLIEFLNQLALDINIQPLTFRLLWITMQSLTEPHASVV